jgi:hypothetical protein
VISVATFTQIEVESIADVLGHTSLGLSGSEIGHLLRTLGMPDPDPNITKRHRLLTDILRIPDPLDVIIPHKETSQRNSILADPLTAKMARRSAWEGRNLPLFRDQGAPLPSFVASAPMSRSCWRGRCPQPGNQRQDVGEHLLRHRDLGHLKSNVAAVADDLRADLDQLLAQAGQ